jgi:hypothetical protein
MYGGMGSAMPMMPIGATSTLGAGATGGGTQIYQ